MDACMVTLAEVDFIALICNPIASDTRGFVGSCFFMHDNRII